jgi:hypothetical protein
VATDKSDNIELQHKITREVTNAIGFPEFVEIARASYHAYGRSTGNKNFRGEEMPTWENLPEPIRVAWIAAVTQATSEFVAHVSGDLGCFLRAYSKGEPTFTLRAQDVSAPDIVIEWIGRNLHASDSKLREAFEKSLRMRSWKTRKAAD